MVKLGIIIDSSTGMTKEEADQLGWGYLPLVLTIGDEEFYDGINLSVDKFYERLNSKVKMYTIATPVEKIQAVVKEMTDKHDFVIVYTISRGLSLQYNHVELAIGDNFKNVYIVRSRAICNGIVKDLEEIETFASHNKDFELIKIKLDELTHKHTGVLIVKSLSFLAKGRPKTISSMLKMVGLVHLYPIIKFENGKLKHQAIRWGFRQSTTSVAEKLISDCGENSGYTIYHAKNPDIEYYKKYLEKLTGKTIEVKLFPAALAIHIGSKAIGILARERQ